MMRKAGKRVVKNQNSALVEEYLVKLEYKIN
jgi:hypothetical protein